MQVWLSTEGYHGNKIGNSKNFLCQVQTSNYKDRSLPRNFSSSFGFFSHVIEFCEMRPFSKHLGVRWLQSMQSSLCMCPLKLTLFLPKVLLSCESNLHNKEINQEQLITKTPLNKALQQTSAIHTLCSITRSQALPLKA